MKFTKHELILMNNAVVNLLDICKSNSEQDKTTDQNQVESYNQRIKELTDISTKLATEIQISE